MLLLRLLTSFLILSLVQMPHRAYSDEPPSTPIKPLVEPAKPSSPINVDVTQKLDWLTSFTINLNALVTGILALGNVPNAFKEAKKSLKDMWNFEENKEAYLKALEQFEMIKEKQPKLLEELGVALDRYNYRLTKLTDFVNESIKDKEIGFDKIDKMLDPIYEKALSLNGLVSPEEQEKLEKAVDRWIRFRDPIVMEEWVDSNIKLLENSDDGKKWHSEFRDARKQWASLVWSKKGSVRALDEWVEIHEPRLPDGHAEKEWMAQYRYIRQREQRAAERFLTDFAIFVRGINVDAGEKDRKFPILVEWTRREPGEFYFPGEHGTVPVLSGELLDKFAKNQCKLIIESLESKLGEMKVKGTKRNLPVQALKVGAPVLGVGVGVTAIYASFQGFMRNLRGEITKPPVTPVAVPGPTATPSPTKGLRRDAPAGEPNVEEKTP